MVAAEGRTRATVSAHEVRKSFGTGRGSRRRVVDVLRGVDLRVMPGEMVVIVGPSGSGKSTLLYCLSGLEEADAGSIEVMGRQVVGAGRGELSKTRRDCVGFIFQSYNLIPSLTAGENVSLPARLAGRPLTAAADGRRARRAWGWRAVRRAGLRTCRAASSSAWPLPGRSRAGPTWCSPTSPPARWTRKNGREVLGLLRGIADDPARSVVMVTHDLEAASMADRVLVLKDGRVLRELGRSTPAEILEALEEAR